MSFEYIVEKDNKVKKLSDTDLLDIAKRISSDFDTLNSQRRSNLDKANELVNEIFFKKDENKLSNNGVGTFSSNNDDKYESWKTKVKMCKTFMFYQVLKAFIWKNVYSNVNSMFDVSGENQESDNDSNKQKAALVDCFEKMEYQKTCDKVIDYALIYGEFITMCAWKKKSEEFRKQIAAEDLLKPKAIAELSKGKFHFVDERTIYDNPYVYPVNPANFVFDVSQKDNWDDCPKIYKSYKVPEDIINNKYYKVSDEVAQAIRAAAKKPESSDSHLDKDLEDEISNGSTVEVLEHWGNFTLKDGTVLKNWHVVVVAREHVVRFEKNNRIVNPFNYGAFVTDPETGRAISPLFCVLPLAQLQEDLMNRTCDMQALQENPPIYAPKGFFDDDEVKLYPGKIIEYGDNISPDKIKQMEFSVNVFLNDITFLSDLMAETSGIFPNMAGADERTAKTATEISTKAQGQLTRLSMLIDTINQYGIVADVKDVAKLRADFKSGDEQIFITKGDQKEVITVNDKIRQAEYRYTYSDRTATTERSNKADMIAQAIERFANFLPLNMPEVFTWYMEQKDVENPERFIQNQQLLSPEVQQALANNPQLAPIIQQMQATVEAQKANEQQEAGNNPQPVTPDASIPEAQPQE